MSDISIWEPYLTLEEIEKITILKALDYFRGNKTATAKSLGISIRTLQNKLAIYSGTKDAKLN